MPGARDPKTDTPKLLSFENKEKKIGRPPKLEVPPLPVFDMEPGELALFDYFLATYRYENPDLTGSDQLTLFLAACEFIKSLRVAQDELSTGKVLSAARQHPLIQFRALLDSLSVTRRQRKPVDKDEADAAEAKAWLLGMSKEA
jgi:hypothetical protein